MIEPFGMSRRAAEAISQAISPAILGVSHRYSVAEAVAVAGLLVKEIGVPHVYSMDVATVNSLAGKYFILPSTDGEGQKGAYFTVNGSGSAPSDETLGTAWERDPSYYNVEWTAVALETGATKAQVKTAILALFDGEGGFAQFSAALGSGDAVVISTRSPVSLPTGIESDKWTSTIVTQGVGPSPRVWMCIYPEERDNSDGWICLGPFDPDLTGFTPSSGSDWDVVQVSMGGGGGGDTIDIPASDSKQFVLVQGSLGSISLNLLGERRIGQEIVVAVNEGIESIAWEGIGDATIYGWPEGMGLGAVESVSMVKLAASTWFARKTVFLGL